MNARFLTAVAVVAVSLAAVLLVDPVVSSDPFSSVSSSASSPSSSSSNASSSRVPSAEPELVTHENNLYVVTDEGEIYFKTSKEQKPIALGDMLEDGREGLRQAAYLGMRLERMSSQTAEKFQNTNRAIDTVTDDLDKFNEEAVSRTNTNANLISQIDSAVARLKLDLGLLDKKVDQQIEEKLRPLQNAMTRIAALESQVGGVQTKVSTLESTLSSHEKMLNPTVVAKTVALPHCSYLKSKANRGARSIRLNRCENAKSGDWFLLHVHRDGDGSTGGQYEFVESSSVRTSDCYITLKKPLRNTYSSGRSQVQRAITYASPGAYEFSTGFSVTARSFDGRCGGIVPIYVNGALKLLGGTINADSRGYRAGTKWTSYRDYVCGHTGEGYCDTFRSRRSCSGRCLAGGAGNGQGGGAGGSNAGQGANGERSGCSHDTGRSSSIMDSNRRDQRYYAFFGGGGGAAGSHNTHDRNGQNGGTGGGIVIIRASGSIAHSGTNINVRGAGGAHGYAARRACQPMGGGGGGAGGTVYLIGQKGVNADSGPIRINGGNGGNRYCWCSCSCGGRGGNGGTGKRSWFTNPPV